MTEAGARSADDADLAAALASAHEQQAALSDVLRTISRSAFDLDAVLQTIVERAARLVGAESSRISRREGDDAVVLAGFGPGSPTAGGPETRIPLSEATLIGRALLTGKRQYIADATLDPSLPQDGPRTRLVIPFLRDGRAIGTLGVSHTLPKPIGDREMRMLETFADQAAIAIENVRLFNETREGLERQTALGEVLRATAASPGNIQPVLDAVAANAARLLDADDVLIARLDGADVVMAAHIGEVPVLGSGVRDSLDPGMVSHRAILEARAIHVPDLLATEDFPKATELARQTGQRTSLAVPLLREGTAIGAILIRRTEVRPFTEPQVQLLQAFADQATIAIENARLFNETKEALERQVALGEVLRTMASSPADLRAVLDAIAQNAARFCAAEDCGLALLRADGLLEQVAHFGPLTRELAPWPVDRGSVRGRAIVERRIIHVEDMLAEREEEYPIGLQRAREVGQRTVLAAPLLHEGTPLGAIALRRSNVKPFTDRQIDLLRTFADQAAIAIDNVRLFNETKSALDRQTATSAVLNVMSREPFDLHKVLNTVVESAVRLCGADSGSIVRIEAGRSYTATHAGTTENITAIDQHFATHDIASDRSSMTGRVLLDRRSVSIADIETDPEYVIRDLPNRRDPGRYHSMLGVPLLRQGEVIGVLLLRRLEIRPFVDAEITLGETFADQAVIAIENVRLFNETKNALERQTAVAQVLGEISQSAFDLGPVLETVIAHATKLCAAQQGFIYRRDGDVFRLAVSYGITPEFKEFTETHPLSGSDLGTVTGRAVQRRTTVHVPDVLRDPEYTYWEAQKRGKFRALLGVPMIRDDTVIGVMNLWRSEPEPFTPEQIDLVTTFANQATIAIENVRLFNETKEALERQTSISDVLQTIGRSAFDLQPVLDTVVERAVKLCDAREGSISTLEDGVYRTRAHWSGSTLSPEYIDFMRHEVRVPDRGSLIGRTVLEGKVVQVDDALADPEYTATDMQQAAGYRTLLGVPLLRDGKVIGVFALTRSEVRPFSDRQIELVRTFADQAAIAIENTRLFAATKEALEQQTAVGEVLKTISRSAFDLQPVLDIVLNNAVRLAGADIGWLSRVENDQFTTVAYSTEFPQAVKEELVRQRAQGHIAGPWIPLGTGGGLMGFTLAEGRTVHLPDVKEDPELKGSTVARLTASRTVVGVPMLRDGRTIGGMVLARYEVRPFGEREIELVQTFADQAAIAIENVRLFNETKESLERQTAISDVLKTISGTVFELEPTLQTVVENAAKLADADLAWMTQRSDRDTFTWGARYARTAELALVYGDLSKLRLELVAPGAHQGIMSRLYTERRTIALSDVEADPDLLDKSRVAKLVGARSLVGVPVLSEGDVLGAIVLARREVRPFSEREVHVVETFADQAAIAIRNVRLFNEIQDKSRQLEVASRHKSEFLANMSHELRTPLNAIIGFSEVLVQGLFGDVNAKQREYLQDVIGSGQHLLSLINDILDLAKIEAGRMELELSTFSFRSALQSGVTIVRERAARNGITLNVDVSDELDRVEADERKVKQILYNLLSNAVKFTPDGGKVNVTVRRDNGDVRVDVQDNGIGIADADQARIFEEFQQVGRERSREGTGLGLTLTKRFVELHGGRIWLESAPGQGSTFTFTLPLRQAAPVRA